MDKKRRPLTFDVDRQLGHALKACVCTDSVAAVQP